MSIPDRISIAAVSGAILLVVFVLGSSLSGCAFQRNARQLMLQGGTPDKLTVNYRSKQITVHYREPSQ